MKKKTSLTLATFGGLKVVSIKSGAAPASLLLYRHSARRPFASGTLYALEQLVTLEVAYTKALLAELSKHGPHLVGTGSMKAMMTLASTVGWVWVEDQADETQLERWLMLDEMVRPSEQDLVIRPADSMDGKGIASAAEFVERAKELFGLRKAAAGDGETERTRYAKVVSKSDVHVAAPETAAGWEWYPASLPSRPGAPGPEGNGTWDGEKALPGGEIDDGTVGLRDPIGGLKGLVVESNSGSSGTTTTLLSADYELPSDSEPLTFVSDTSVEADEALALSDDLGGDRRWRVTMSSSTFYSESFPDEG